MNKKMKAEDYLGPRELVEAARIRETIRMWEYCIFEHCNGGQPETKTQKRRMKLFAKCWNISMDQRYEFIRRNRFVPTMVLARLFECSGDTITTAKELAARGISQPIWKLRRNKDGMRSMLRRNSSSAE